MPRNPLGSRMCWPERMLENDCAAQQTAHLRGRHKHSPGCLGQRAAIISEQCGNAVIIKQMFGVHSLRDGADLNETHSLRGTSIKLAWNVNGVDFEKSLSAKTAWTLMLSVCASTLNIRKGKETKHSDSFWLHWICLYFRCERRDRIKSVLYKVKQSMPTASLCA